MSRIPPLIRSLRLTFRQELKDMSIDELLTCSWLTFAYRELDKQNLTPQEWAEAETLL